MKLISFVLTLSLGPLALAAPPSNELPTEEAAKETAKKFLDAIGRGDDAEAKKCVLGPADCEAMAPPISPAQLTKCREELKDDPALAVALVRKTVPAGFVVGKIAVEYNSPAPGIALVHAAAKKGDAKTSIMLLQLGTRTRVVVAKLSK